MRQQWAFGLAALAIGALGVGCGAPESEPTPSLSDTWAPAPAPDPLPPVGVPTVMDDPAIMWADGIEPTSPLEDNKLVRILRESELGLAMAWNTGDFTIRQFTDHMTDEIIIQQAGMYSRGGDDLSIYPAMSSWYPLTVLSESDEGGELVICQIETGDGLWTKTKDDLGGSYDRSRTLIYRITIEIKNGKSYVSASTPTSRFDDEFAPCDGQLVPVGFIDPPPELPATPVTEPVREPLIPNWREVYDPDGRNVNAPTPSPTSTTSPSTD